MFFSKSARVFAIVALVFGLMDFLRGNLIAFELILPYHEALARYAPGKSSSGQVIDRGIYTVLFGVALGTLAEISFQVKRVLEKL